MSSFFVVSSNQTMMLLFAALMTEWVMKTNRYSGIKWAEKRETMRFEFNIVLVDKKWNKMQDIRTALAMEAGKVYLERNDR